MSLLKRFLSIFKRVKKPSWFSRYPSCYGHYFDSTPTIARNLRLGCDKCPYFTYNEENCMVNSIKKKGNFARTRTEESVLAVDQDIGRFMKVHGRQSKEYRASIKNKVPVEEKDEED